MPDLTSQHSTPGILLPAIGMRVTGHGNRCVA